MSAAHDDTVLVTGAGGYVGQRLVKRLVAGDRYRVVAVDLAAPTPESRLPGVEYVALDVRSPRLAEVLGENAVGSVVHLAAIVTPTADRDLAYSVDVDGSRNVLDACLEAEVRRLIVTSSGAAYGYHPDNPRWIRETQPLRGNVDFPYAHHKRLVEEMLAAYRDDHPQLEQVVFRVATVLGSRTDNEISALFDRSLLIGVRGGDDRFVFIWDEDVARCLERALGDSPAGVYNLAADGAISLKELAVRMRKWRLALPAGLLRMVLAAGCRLGMTRYGPEQVGFLQYRPVLDNGRLKSVFGFEPAKNSSEVFDLYVESRSR